MVLLFLYSVWNKWPPNWSQTSTTLTKTPILVTCQIHISNYKNMSIHTCCKFQIVFSLLQVSPCIIFINRQTASSKLNFYQVKRNMTNAIRWISNICYLQNLLLENIMERRDFYTISFFFPIWKTGNTWLNLI